MHVVYIRAIYEAGNRTPCLGPIAKVPHFCLYPKHFYSHQSTWLIHDDIQNVYEMLRGMKTITPWNVWPSDHCRPFQTVSITTLKHWLGGSWYKLDHLCICTKGIIQPSSNRGGSEIFLLTDWQDSWQARHVLVRQILTIWAGCYQIQLPYWSQYHPACF